MPATQNKLFSFILIAGFTFLGQRAPADTGAARPITETCALKFPAQNLCATLIFDAPPTAGNEATLHLAFHPLQKVPAPSPSNGQNVSQPADPAVDPVGDLSLFLWMPDMGHGSSPTSIVHDSTGVYVVSKLYFVMSGLWEIHVEIKNQHCVEQAVFNQNIN